MGRQDFPHERIRQQHDRSYTPALVDALASPDVPAAQRAEIARTLAHLCDPRSLVPLRRILFDRLGPVPLREAAAEALRDIDMEPVPTDAELRALWVSGDVVLRHHALVQMEQAQADLVEPVATDPDDPLHLAAIETLTFGFIDPRSVELRIAALTHRDPAVRFAAADALLFDEPIAAGPALLAAVMDPDPKVVDQHRYHEQWLQNLLISASLGGYRNHRLQPQNA